jgi:cytochrome c2
MKKDVFDRRAFLKGAVAGSAAAVTVSMPRPSEAQQGALDDFRYSPALKRSGITWTQQTLDAYVADPQKAVPQNRMPYAGMPEARDRADLILYMQQIFK